MTQRVWQQRVIMTSAGKLHVWAVGWVVLCSIAAYATSFGGTFVLDDNRYIVDNPRIQDISDIVRVVSGRRPVLDATLALNRAIGGTSPTGYHVVNLTIHVLAALTLMSLIHGVAICIHPESNPLHSLRLALPVSLLWAVHPLQTQSVTYLTQRSESLMGLFYLLTLYCVMRGARSSRHNQWYIMAVVACALGMGCKGVMVTAPLIVLLFDRSFLASSFVEIWRKRWVLYLALVSTWGMLIATQVATGVLSASKNHATVGFSYKGTSPFEYLTTQAGVLLHYITLSFWPYPLCLDYGWKAASGSMDIVMPGLFVVLLLVLIAVAWLRVRWRWLGFIGAWFFVVLAPTSSIIPIKDTMFEHRMYLPLASILFIATLGAQRVLRTIADRLRLQERNRRRLNSTLISCTVLLLMGITAVRNTAYAGELGMWRNILNTRPNNDRAAFNIGTLLMDQNRLEEAKVAFERTILIRPDWPDPYYNLGKTLQKMGHPDQAARKYELALRINPGIAEIHNDLANLLTQADRLEEAIGHYREAMRLDPKYARAPYNLGILYLGIGEPQRALGPMMRAAELSPNRAMVQFGLAETYRQLGQVQQAADAYRRTIAMDPNHARARQALDVLSSP